MTAEPAALDLALVQDSFSRSLCGEDDVAMELYMRGYEELVKFLNLIGSVFSFVSSDVRSKLRQMERHLEADTDRHYVTFSSMMKYEKENKLHEKSGFVSGSRTMLRLHRGLDFIRLFLRRLSDEEECVNTCAVCQTAYGESLARHHPWYIRRAATLAMHALPHRPELLKKVFYCDTRLEAALAVLSSCFASCDEVYRRVEQLYADFDFQVFGCDARLEAALAVLPSCLASCDEVYRRVEQLYADFDFHALP